MTCRLVVTGQKFFNNNSWCLVMSSIVERVICLKFSCGGLYCLRGKDTLGQSSSEAVSNKDIFLVFGGG